MKLNVFTYKTEEYKYSFDNQISIKNAPNDADWSRWAMLHDGSHYRLYCFKKDTNHTLYQFAFDGVNYTFGHESISEITLENVPEHVNTTVFAMLHDGKDYRLYLGDKSNSDILHQFEWNSESYVYKPELTMQIAGLSLDADTDVIAMLHNGEDYIYYALDVDKDRLHLAVYNSNVHFYEAINTLPIVNIPQQTNKNSFSMLYSEDGHFLYFLENEHNSFEKLVEKPDFLK